ncbi:MAG: methyl-accepting chemotaxis protein [Lachnospiraceae bacterium]
MKKKHNKEKRVLEIPFYKSISLHLTVCFLIPVIGILVLGAVSYNSASKAVINSYKKSISHTADMQQKYINLAVSSEIDEFKNYFTDSALRTFFGGKMDMIEANTLKKKYNGKLVSKLSMDSKASGVYFIADGGRSLQGGNVLLPSDAYSAYIATNQGRKVNENPNEWFIFGQDTEADGVLGIDTELYGVRIARKFQGRQVCIIVDIGAEFIRNVLQSVDTGKNGCVALITSDGKEFYAEPGAEDKNSLIYGTDVYNNVVSSEEVTGNQIIQLNGRENLFVYGKMETGGAVVAALIPSKRLLDEAADIKMVSAVVSGIFAVLALVLGLVISRKMSGIINYILQKLRKISNGDLTVQLKAKSKDEFGLLCAGVNQTASNMKAILEDVKVVSAELNDAISYVTKSAGLFTETARDIKDALSEIETGVSRLDTGSADCLGNMEMLSEIITSVSENTEEIGKLAGEAGETIRTGIELVNSLGGSSAKTTDITKDVIASIQELENKSKSISTIVSAINSISEQTDLLSINASIEAARAGDAGKGFAVVAEEIRKLSGQCLESAGQISDIVNEIIQQTSEVVSTAKEAEEAVSSQTGVVSETTESFRQIGQQIDRLLAALETITGNVYNMDTSKNKTLGTIEDISAVSAETSACSENVSITVQKQEDAVGDLEGPAKQLQAKADSLIEILGSFQL